MEGICVNSFFDCLIMSCESKEEFVLDDSCEKSIDLGLNIWDVIDDVQNYFCSVSTTRLGMLGIILSNEVMESNSKLFEDRPLLLGS